MTTFTRTEAAALDSWLTSPPENCECFSCGQMVDENTAVFDNIDLVFFCDESCEKDYAVARRAQVERDRMIREAKQHVEEAARWHENFLRDFTEVK